jgi:D-sedoheptulose 7-phosphate isomerase
MGVISPSEAERLRIESANLYLAGLRRCLDALPIDQLAGVIEHLEQAYWAGRQVFVMGNGGSAATASHMVGDLAKNILPREGGAGGRRLRIMSLTDNVPWLSALANDLGYQRVFSEQIRNLVQAQDVVVVISASGNSPNILEALRAAREAGATTVGILGFDGGRALAMVDAYVLVASDNYGHIEDLHVVVAHLITQHFARCTTLYADGLVGAVYELASD